MWISSLVVTLGESSEIRRPVIDSLQAIHSLTVGESPSPNRIPVVVEAGDAHESRYWCEWIEQLPGVVKVDVAFVSCDDDPKLEAAPCESVVESLR